MRKILIYLRIWAIIGLIVLPNGLYGQAIPNRKYPTIKGIMGLNLGMSKTEVLQKIKKEGWRVRDAGCYVFVSSYYFPEPDVEEVILSFSRGGRLHTIALDCPAESYDSKRSIARYMGASLIKSLEERYGHPHSISYGDTRDYDTCPRSYKTFRLKAVVGDDHSTKMSLMVAWHARDNRGITATFNKKQNTIYCSVSFLDHELIRE